jgi:hypothetical protein
MYFEIQRICSLVAEAASPHQVGFDPEFRLRQELKRVLRDVPDHGIPEDLRDAVVSGAVVGPAAASWLPVIRTWLETECNRTGV